MRMDRSEGARITYVWVAACVFTVVSAIVATVTGDHRGANVVVSLVVLGMGAVKAGLILEEFMEVRTAPPWLQRTARVWLVGLLAVIIVLYLQ